MHPITLTRRGITVEVALHHQSYGTDRFGIGYSLSHQGFWQGHGSGDLWQEVSRTDTVEMQAAA